MDQILQKARVLNSIIQESPAGTFSFNELACKLSDLMDANVYVLNCKGKLIGKHFSIITDSVAFEDPETGEQKLSQEYNDELLKVNSTKSNLSSEEALKIFKHHYATKDKLHTIVPMLGGGKRLGTIVLTRYKPNFSDDEIVLAEFGATVIGLEIERAKDIEGKAQAREIHNIRTAVKTLSYSELEAINQILKEIDGDQGLVVASKIADSSNITRSVIVNALRKLESAGLLESRSLGMKGTHIKITCPHFIEEVERLLI